jgi:hypothetical protein
MILYLQSLTNKIMAKEMNTKENPVVDVLKKLKEEEAELTFKLRPVQEAIAALEKIVDKSVKKGKNVSNAKVNGSDEAEELIEVGAEA